MATTVSANGVKFTGIGEGFVSHYYRDAGGVGTIGHGFTTGSKVFNDYWQKTRGHKLRKGDTITEAESLIVLAKVVAAEYAPPVAKRFGSDIPQNEFDAATDTCYNAGPGTLKDKWAGALTANAVAKAAELLRSTRITAGGRKLAGLVNRRAREARLLESGDYGFTAVEPPQPNPAERAAAVRSADAAVAKKVAATTAPGGAAVTAAPHATSLDPHMLMIAAGVGLAALAVVGLAYLAWSYRGVILNRRTPA